MNQSELLELIAGGENSVVEFKRDDVCLDMLADTLAREMSALLNFEGGYILLGVEDDGEITGLTRGREQAERWVMDVAYNNLQPSVIPFWQPVAMDGGKVVGVIRLAADSPDKPHKARRGRAWVTFVRVGSTSREARREEEGRLYQAASLMRHDTKPVLDTSLDSLDAQRLDNYFSVILERDAPADAYSWRRTLLNMDILTESGGRTVATAAGLLLFGEYPNRRLPQAGITAAAFPTAEKDYDTIDEELIRGPLVPVRSIKNKEWTVDTGVIDRAVDFVRRNTGTIAWLDGARRIRKPIFPVVAIRESIVNAVAHRDYTLAGTDVEVSLYSDRLEVISPGRLPNGVTVDKMAEGLRVSRNEMLKEILRDYGYVEHMGMGVRNRIIGAMREHNGTEPDLIEDDNRFIVRLWKEG